MIIVRLHLLLVPPQKPDFELSNSDEIFFFFNNSPHWFWNGIWTIWKSFRSPKEKEKKTKQTLMDVKEGKKKNRLHHMFINTVWFHYGPSKAIRKQTFQSAVWGSFYSNCECPPLSPPKLHNEPTNVFSVVNQNPDTHPRTHTEHTSA